MILDGSALSKTLREEVAEATRGSGVKPGLATILVGDDPASFSYVGSKQRACERAGFKAEDVRLPGQTTQAELEDVIQGLNARDDIHGVLVQQPLPKQIDTEVIVASVDPDKDVDGFHPVNLGRLMRGDRGFLPCTPFGITRLLSSAGISVSGKNVVIVGRSLLVGKPLALMFLAKMGQGGGLQDTGDATVTVCHSRTCDLPAVTLGADILVCAIGIPEFVRADMVREGATVVDVGINRVDDSTKPRGYRLVGDVMYDEVAEKAGAITPVPGGVGPMTVTMLLYNTLQSARKLYSQDPL
ncbi:MAG: bifunctional methylenetetrahydrofolate dehydrogenase/methenyltetrahydrofolate cyclohydrolase FolD [Spirochaetales bacterium]|nr:bifunctional methylenetetrahydrofolate dehydrogenase/methenyltetrahydrofolate cyclohydrolase FolD [Spirochaetales bacterium]